MSAIRKFNTVEYYRGILDNLTGGLVSVDLSGRLIYVNPMAGRILHITDVSWLIANSFESALGGYPALCQVISETIKTHKTVRRAEVSVLHSNTPLIIGYSTLQIKNRKSDIIGIAVIFQDITFVSPAKRTER